MQSREIGYNTLVFQVGSAPGHMSEWILSMCTVTRASTSFPPLPSHFRGLLYMLSCSLSCARWRTTLVVQNILTVDRMCSHLRGIAGTPQPQARFNVLHCISFLLRTLSVLQCVSVSVCTAGAPCIQAFFHLRLNTVA